MSELISEHTGDVLSGRETALLFNLEGLTPDGLTEAQYDSNPGKPM